MNWSRTSGRSMAVRIAAAAALVSAVSLVGGALLMRSALFDSQVQATVRLAALESDSIVTATQLNVRLGGDFGPLPYELVRSDGIVVSSSPELVPFESNGPLMPVPALAAESLVDVPQRTELPTGVDSPIAGTTMTVVSGTIGADQIQHASTGDLPGGPGPAGTTYRVYVFATPDFAAAAVATVDPYLWVGIALAALLVAGTAAFAVRRSLRPVERMRRAADAITATSVRRRVDVPASDDELAALARTLNTMLDRLDSALGAQRRFSADAAHELRSPLSSLLASLEIARAYPETIDRDQVFDHALAEGRRVQDLAEELLTLSAAGAQPDRDALEGDAVTGDIAAVVRDALSSLPMPTEAPPEIALDIDGNLPAVSIPPARLSRVLRNLLENAVRHSRAIMGVDVVLRDNRVRLVIHNDGDPIPLDQLESIFEPFVRLDEARSRDDGGAGLGLAISRDLVRQWGGTITAESRPGRTAFVIELTVSAALEPASL